MEEVEGELKQLKKNKLNGVININLERTCLQTSISFSPSTASTPSTTSATSISSTSPATALPPEPPVSRFETLWLWRFTRNDLPRISPFAKCLPIGRLVAEL